MQKFEYKSGFWPVKVEIAQEMIAYKGKTIPANQITGVGIGLLSVKKTTAISTFGLLGHMLTRKSLKEFEEVNKTAEIKDIPVKRGQLMIAYKNPGEEKTRLLRIPINLHDQNCQQMLETVKKHFSPIYVGVGPMTKVQIALGISNKAAFIVVAVIIFGIGALIIISSITRG